METVRLMQPLVTAVAAVARVLPVGTQRVLRVPVYQVLVVRVGCCLLVGSLQPMVVVVLVDVGCSNCRSARCWWRYGRQY